MMNGIWLILVVSAVVAGAFSGRMQEVSAASVDAAKSAVTLALGLIGVMAFWLGLMRVVQEAGLLHVLARRLRPLMVRLFPEVPPDHPAMSAMILNIASNMLGLGNAATPFGIKAMMALDELNPRPGVATNAMALFLAINTSNVALAPLGVIALRASMGSRDPAGIWIPTLLATAFSTLVAILAARGLQRLYPPVTAYPPSRKSPARNTAIGDPPADPEDRLPSPSPSRRALAWTVGAAIACALLLHARSELAGGASAGAVARGVLSAWLLPVLIIGMLLYGWVRRVPVYDAAVEGAREGFDVAVRIIPFLVAILVAVAMCRAAGLIDLLVQAAAPVTGLVGFPPEALPMAILRPLSGSGAYGVMAEIMQAEGPDSFVGYLVSTLQGSTETTFYVLAVYFGAVGVTRVRHALAAGLIADAAGIAGSLLAVRLVVGA